MGAGRLSRQVVYGRNGMVCTNSPLSAAAGLKVLQEGGTAFDAALAVAATETVTMVPMCGIGGDSFILLYEAANGSVTGISSSGVAGSGASAESYWKRARRGCRSLRLTSAEPPRCFTTVTRQSWYAQIVQQNSPVKSPSSFSTQKLAGAGRFAPASSPNGAIHI